jgi:hypothetical protein
MVKRRLEKYIVIGLSYNQSNHAGGMMEPRTVMVYAIVAIGLGSLAVALWISLAGRVRRLEVEVRRIIVELNKLKRD